LSLRDPRHEMTQWHCRMANPVRAIIISSNEGRFGVAENT
jgi:hypothetical protein